NSASRPVPEDRPAAGRGRGPDLDDGAGGSNPGGDAPLPLGGRAGYPPAWWGRVGWADTPAAMERPVVVTEPYPAPTRVGRAAGRHRSVPVRPRAQAGVPTSLRILPVASSRAGWRPLQLTRKRRRNRSRAVMTARPRSAIKMMLPAARKES